MGELHLPVLGQTNEGTIVRNARKTCTCGTISTHQPLHLFHLNSNLAALGARSNFKRESFRRKVLVQKVNGRENWHHFIREFAG